MCYLCTKNANVVLKTKDGRHYTWDTLQHTWTQQVQANQQTPPAPAPGPPAQVAPPIPSAKGTLKGFAGLPPAPAPGLGPGQGPQPVTKTNSTMDPRIIWEDGHVAIIYAKDFPANAGMGRSKTRSDIKDAVNAQIDDQLQTATGKGSAHDFVKVWLKELLARPLPSGAPPVVKGRLPIDPRQFVPVSPVIASSGSYKGHIIPDFPHDCAACGGKYYQGMFSGVHDTADGRCPATHKGDGKKKR